MKERSLGVRAVLDAPLSEISGLGQRPRSPAGPPQILAVGDEDFTVVSATIGSSTEVSEFHRHGLEDALAGSGAPRSSEWEAADGDRSGRVFILQESPGVVYIFSPELDRLLHVVELSVEESGRLDWAKEPNKQGEGLVLLGNGHVLIAKEKDPPLLMEFGPRGDGAQGVDSELLLLGNEEFPLPPTERTEHVLLSTWDLDADAQGRISDISDVAVGKDERLYMLSDESRCIARLEHRLPPEHRRLSVTGIWTLPGVIEQPEGLVLLDDQTPVVAIDRQEPRSNLFVLDHLEE
jgi:SdiA-regulated